MTTIVATTPRVPPVRWPVPEERRTVTVLFVDIVGSTALVDRLDPEDVRALQRAYFDTVARVLRRWHGVVEKYIGDAVMALFGARESDGFDAYRAVRAGLDIQRALDGRPLLDGTTIRVRVGVATGEAVVDLAAARGGGHGAASGAVITTAARLQEYAPPGAVALCAVTHRATAGLVTQRRLAPVTVPGRVPPMTVWHAVGPATPPAPRHDGPLVGRRRELATVRDQIVRAVRERSPRWVAVVGPSGSGRSRLLHELTRAVGAVDGAPVRWCVASCPPYPEQPMAPVAELLRGLAGAGVDDPPAVLRERLAATLAGLLAPSRLAVALPALERLLAAPDGTADTAAGAAWCQEVLLRLAARTPVVVAVDDLDRAAPTVGRFLHALFTAAAARELPLVVVALHGQDRADELPAAHPRCRVPVRPLAPVQTGRLLRHLLTGAGQQVSLVDRLLPLVGGHPGHAQAYVRSLVDGADPVAPPVPEAIRRAVGTELDRLDGERRAALMAAATLDVRFSEAAVERLLGWAPGRARPVLSLLLDAGHLLAHPAGGYAIATPALRRLAADRLTRRVRGVFARRVADATPVGAGVPAAHRTVVTRPAPRRASGEDRTDATPAERTRSTAVRSAQPDRNATVGSAQPARRAPVGSPQPDRVRKIPSAASKQPTGSMPAAELISITRSRPVPAVTPLTRAGSDPGLTPPAGVGAAAGHSPPALVGPAPELTSVPPKRSLSAPPARSLSAPTRSLSLVPGRTLSVAATGPPAPDAPGSTVSRHAGAASPGRPNAARDGHPAAPRRLAVVSVAAGPRPDPPGRPAPARTAPRRWRHRAEAAA
ncbi:adenylate/guanylate cyclase domain-containing protein [Micromonospora sp. NPDC094482]|uniref:AAA family ATPase n=1 Tax=unclassified Micromonospora TaxID=2617518 RepID=UPI00332A5921